MFQVACSTAQQGIPVAHPQQEVVDDDVADVLCLCQEEDIVPQRYQRQAVQHTVEGTQAYHGSNDALQQQWI